MATPLAPPPPVGQDVDSRQFRDWFYSLYALLGQPGQTLGTMAYQNADSVAVTGGAIGGVGISGSTINNTPIGQTFAADGRFNDLEALGTVSGVGYTNLFASPPPLGSTTPNRVNTNALKTTALTGYLYGNGTGGDVTASTTIPISNIVTGYGSFQNTADQTFATANTATKIVVNTTDFIKGMTRSGSTITDITPGIYNVQFSLQVANTDSSIHEIEIWLRKNGSDVAGTATKFSISSRHGSVDGYVVPVANFFVELATTDTLELWGAVSNTSLYIEAYPVQTTPFARPSIPSTVLTLTQAA